LGDAVAESDPPSLPPIFVIPDTGRD